MPSLPTTVHSYLPPAPMPVQSPPAGAKGTAPPVAAAVIPRGANRRDYALSPSADAVMRMKRHLGQLPPARGLGDLPPELVHHLASHLDDPADVLALSRANGTLHATLASELKIVRVDLLIRNIRSDSQYNYARDEVHAMPEPLRAQRIAALVRKSNYSQDEPVQAFQHLAAELKEVAPPHRGDGFGMLTDMLRLMSVGDIPLTRDQERSHATLLELALDMPAPLQRQALTYLSQQWLPPAAVANAQAALAALGPPPGHLAAASA